MALEKRLLEMANKADPKVTESWLLYLLEKSQSVSITAVVVSIVLSQPDKFFDVACILFKTVKLMREFRLPAALPETSFPEMINS